MPGAVTQDFAALIDTLNFVAPEFLLVSNGDKRAALRMAEQYRPAGLPAATQDEAQALYAAWLLKARANSTLSADGAALPAGPIIMEKEGDLQRQYADSAKGGASLLTLGDYRARYDEIAARAGRGAILVGQAFCGPYARVW